MDDRLRNLKGSTSRDQFKWAHKHICSTFYACDADFVLVEKNPPGIAAYIDFKGLNDSVTFSEVLAYNVWMTTAPVYIVESGCPETGPFNIFKYSGGNWRPNPPKVDLVHVTTCQSWSEYEEWERKVRNDYKKPK